jgi:hypothetical protein
LREGDFVSIGHAGEKSSKAKFAMRKYKCYEILAMFSPGQPPATSNSPPSLLKFLECQ